MGKLTEAYNLGTNGHELTPDAKWLERFAYRRGKKTFGRALTEDALMDAANHKRFNDTLEHAQGLNKSVLQILRAAENIPKPTSMRPLKGYNYTEAGKRVRRWEGAFSFGVNKNDPSRSLRDPLTQDTGPILLDNSDWTHYEYGFKSAVHNISLHCEVPEDREGNMGYVSSVIVINDKNYDPDTLELDYTDTITGNIHLTIDANGQLVRIQRSSSSTTGLVDEPVETSTVNLPEFLHDLQVAVDHTVLTYRGDDLPPAPESSQV